MLFIARCKKESYFSKIEKLFTFKTLALICLQKRLICGYDMYQERFKYQYTLKLRLVIIQTVANPEQCGSGRDIESETRQSQVTR